SEKERARCRVQMTPSGLWGGPAERPGLRQPVGRNGGLPPAQTVEADLREWLANSGVFAAGTPPGSRLNSDFTLESELTTFIADPHAGVARVALALVLLDQHQAATKVLLQRTASGEAKLAGGDPPAIVDAMRAAIVQVLQRTEADVAAAM